MPGYDLYRGVVCGPRKEFDARLFGDRASRGRLNLAPLALVRDFANDHPLLGATEFQHV